MMRSSALIGWRKARHACWRSKRRAAHKLALAVR
jgi:hypothetical protein